MRETTCAFTGHRPHKFPWKYDEADPRCIALKAVLAEQVAKLVNMGVTDFFSGMADGAVRLVWNENLKSKVPQEVLDAVDDTIAKIESGEIHVPNEYE